MTSVRTRKTHRRGKPRKKVEPLDEGLAGKRKRRKYTDEEIEIIKRRYTELVQEGLSDRQIGKKIGEELGRSSGSVKNKIMKLRKNNKIEDNSNKKKIEKKLTSSELKLIKRRYVELLEEDLIDNQIARRIAKELGRSISSLKTRIRKMRKKGEIEENPNRQERKEFSENEIELIKRRYSELVEEGLNDRQVAKKISSELKRGLRVVEGKLKLLRKNKEIEENPSIGVNYLSEEEVELIKRRYFEFLQEGLDDFNIAKKIGEELGRNARSLANKIRQLKKSGEFADAEALREREDILGVAEALEEFGEEDG